MIGKIRSFVEEKKKALNISWFLILLGLIVLYTVYMSITQVVRLYTITQEHETVTQKIEEETIIQQRLQEECQKLNDKNYIEQVARDELGLVKEGEVPYISRQKKTN